MHEQHVKVVQNYCFKDFNDHHKELGIQLDGIEGERDLFRQMLTENSANPQNHRLVQRIDRWEEESINKIRLAAGEARRILLDHTTNANRKLEEKLEVLTNQLRQSREEDDFFEPKLNQWKNELAEMKAELEKPSDVTIRNSARVLVTNITIDIRGKISSHSLITQKT